jgi:hypothetical protein
LCVSAAMQSCATRPSSSLAPPSSSLLTGVCGFGLRSAQRHVVQRRCDARSASAVQGSTGTDMRVEAPSAGALPAGVDQGATAHCQRAARGERGWMSGVSDPVGQNHQGWCVPEGGAFRASHTEQTMTRVRPQRRPAVHRRPAATSRGEPWGGSPSAVGEKGDA